MRVGEGGMERVRCFAPYVAALAGFALIAAGGRTQRQLSGSFLEDRLYGFFFDRYPLFAFAIVYGAVAIIAAAFEPGRRWVRLVTAPLGVALFLAACLYPTFGGLVLRPGFMAASGAFLANVPLPAAWVLGATVAAFVYGFALSLALMLARLARPALGWSAVRAGLLRFVAIWFGALVIGAPRALGLDPLQGWPARPLSVGAALSGFTLVAVALLPHALSRDGHRRDTDREPVVPPPNSPDPALFFPPEPRP